MMVLGGEERLECEIFVDGIRFQSMSQNLNSWDIFWTNRVEMRQGIVRRWGIEGGLQVLLGLWLTLGVWSLSVLGSCNDIGEGDV